jgi:hypothetical protein
MNRADELGSLHLCMRVPTPRFSHLRLHCHTCATGGLGDRNGYSFDGWDFDELVEQKAMLLCYTHGGASLVLPFDSLFFRAHLLHEIRPEYDHAWRGPVVVVQALGEFPLEPLTYRRLASVQPESYPSRYPR